MSLNHRRDYNRRIRAWLLKVGAFAARLDKKRLTRRPCPVCGSHSSRPFAHNGALGYERCGKCALVFMNPTFRPGTLERGFAGEDALLREYFRLMVRYKAAPLPGRIDPRTDGKLKDLYRFRRSGRLLDVGCSVGDFLYKAKPFYAVEGVEINPRTAAVAAKNFTVHRGTLDQLNLPPVYDIVTLHKILYGVPDPVGLLRDIAGVLKPGGLLYVNTPNADSLAMRLFGGQCNHLYGYTAQQVFGRRAFEMLAAKAGFKIVSYRTEWLDIYLPDVVEFLSRPERFLHKRNSHLPGYEEAVREEDALHARQKLDLGDGGNYLVAVLRRR